MTRQQTLGYWVELELRTASDAELPWQDFQNRQCLEMDWHFSSSIYYRKEIADVQFPAKAPVSIRLTTENTGTWNELNPKMYERIVNP